MFKEFTVGRPLDGDMSLILVTGTIVEVMGLDVPERIEGAPLDHIQLDEIANMKPEVWTNHIRPMLAERGGTADFTGTPEGRGHFYQLWCDALDDDAWGAFTWTSEEVLPTDEVDRLKHDLDDLTYQQECCASFVNFEGLAYYEFKRAIHIGATIYDPQQPIALCMDFNAKPGNCSVIQEHPRIGTQVIGEVFINRYSNTEEVTAAFIDKYKSHKGEIQLYGDPAGNQKKSSGVRGTDWDIVRVTLQKVFHPDRLAWRVSRSAPSIRDSINAVNGRLKSKLFRVDPSCKWMIKDLEGTERDETGTLKKIQGDLLTHLTDGLRYYMQRRHPVAGIIGGTTRVM